jgi:glycine betaine/choline ABC-type transport system substrate-binding protein
VLTAEIGQLLDAVSARLTTQNVTKLVGDVVIDGEDVPTVARQFLTENGLL